MGSEFTIRELNEEDFFDPLLLSPSAPFTQSDEYRKWQKGLEREVKRFLIEQGGLVLGFFQTIKFELPFGKSYIYSPYGPILKINTLDSNGRNELLSYLKKYLLELYRHSNVVFVRLDFTLTSENKNISSGDADYFHHSQKYFKRAPKSTYLGAYFQPRQEWFLDITPPEGNLLKAAHEKTRYLIGLAGRKGIETEIVESNFKNYFEQFYSLLSGTAERNGFSLHPKTYYEHIFGCIEKNPINPDFRFQAYLSIAKYDGEILVMNLIVRYGNVAHFIFGGSSDAHRNLSPSHLAQWAAIVHAKKIGAKSYNFGGISADDGTHKSWDGLSSFKKKFGGHAVSHEHTYDLVIKRFWYTLYVFRKVLKSR